MGFVQEWEDWHRQKEAVLSGPHGFLAITGLHWLNPEPSRFEDAPGSWSATAEGVVVELDEGQELTVDGQTVRGRHSFGVIAERDSVYADWGAARLEIAKRGGNDILRPRHPDSPLRTAFTYTPAYAPDPRWLVEGRFLPYEEPRPVTVGAAVEGLEHVYDSPGQVEFELEGARHRLTAFRRADGPVHRQDLRPHDVRGEPLPPDRRTRRGRQGRDRLQPRGEPALRLHRPGDLPAPARREPAAGRGRGG